MLRRRPVKVFCCTGTCWGGGTGSDLLNRGILAGGSYVVCWDNGIVISLVESLFNVSKLEYPHEALRTFLALFMLCRSIL